MAEVKRTLTYRRAVWSRREANQNLESHVRLIHQRLQSTQDRTFSYAEGEISGLTWVERQNVILVHVAQYVPRESTSLVPLPSTTDRSSNTIELPPPGNTNFLRGDIMFLVAGDHIVFCPSGAREAVVGAYLEAASEKLGLSWASNCTLESVADISKLRLIRTEGVKRIRLDASLYEATLAYEDAQETTTVRQSVIGHLGEAIRDYFSTDPRLSEIGEGENITVRVEISYDRRKKGGAVGERRMETMARKLINDDEEGFQIITREDKVIQPNELKIRQVLPLIVFGNTVDREAAWVALTEFYRELRTSGALET